MNKDLNDINTFDDIPQHVKDLFEDTCAGICYSQKMASEGYDLSKVKEYKPKTNIPQIIEEILRKSNYRQGYEWDHEKEFTSCGCKIKVLEYGIDTDDWCIIERDGKKVKIAKRALREWWDDRDKV